MRKHFTLNSLTSLPSEKKPAASGNKKRNDVSPREFVIRNILNYSLALSVMHTREAGCVKMVMN